MAWMDDKAGDTATRRPGVLFLCVHNAGRSQMAAGFMESLAGDRVNVLSAGSDPGARANPVAVTAMAEMGIDISHASPRKWTRDMFDEVDLVVTMGCGDTCPVLPGKRYVDWILDDPAGQDLRKVRAIRDEIHSKVRELLEEI